MKIKYKGQGEVKVVKGDIEYFFKQGEIKDIPDEIAQDLLATSVFEQVIEKVNLKKDGGE